MTTIYANQRQTTEHTAKSIKFTHTESLGGRKVAWENSMISDIYNPFKMRVDH